MKEGGSAEVRGLLSTSPGWQTGSQVSVYGSPTTTLHLFGPCGNNKQKDILFIMRLRMLLFLHANPLPFSFHPSLLPFSCILHSFLKEKCSGGREGGRVYSCIHCTFLCFFLSTDVETITLRHDCVQG